jgi:flavin-dependent dehydrogenase
VCGEFVSAESLALLASLLDGSAPEVLENAPRISQARLFAEGRTITTDVDPPAVSIPRFDLDSALWDAAIKAGVAAGQRVRVDSITGAGPFRVKTSAGDCESRAVIQASGRWSNLSQSGAAGTTPEKWLGLKAHFTEADPSPSVDLYFFDGGYCGVQPIQLADPNGTGRVNVCSMVRAETANNLDGVLAQHGQLRERARTWQPLTEPVTTSPLLFREPRPVDQGVLLVGDAAGFVDPFVGDGISLALRSGALAAECLMPFLRGSASLQQSIDSYQEEYRRQLLPVFRSSSWLRRLLDLPRPLRSSIARLMETMPGITNYLARKTR